MLLRRYNSSSKMQENDDQVQAHPGALDMQPAECALLNLMALSRRVEQYPVLGDLCSGMPQTVTGKRYRHRSVGQNRRLTGQLRSTLGESISIQNKTSILHGSTLTGLACFIRSGGLLKDHQVGGNGSHAVACSNLKVW